MRSLIILVVLLVWCASFCHPKPTFGVLEKISSGIQNVRQKTRCGLHKIGGSLVRHEHHHDPCEVQVQPEIVDNAIDKDVSSYDVAISATTEPILIDIRAQDVTSTTPQTVTVPGGRNIFASGSNCAPGYRADSRGICREEY